MVGKKIDGVRIEYRIKGEKGAIKSGIVTHVEYCAQEEVSNKVSGLFESYDIEWIMIDKYYRRSYDRVEM